ncbi:LysR substrate-binding domain-containing protein [Phyllobacterium sp. SB3]|uniref:LysR substrate-binding domain-containing protein n=1 Tax=Phyllobacterium sp. SB3 TaxID=3156073 RepID=UPI0032AFD295
MRKLPPLNYLQAFEAAARHRSFTEAARELNCTQAAISQRVRGLESIFGRSLFYRLPSGVVPTEAAEVYLRGIGEAFDQLQSITKGLAGRASPKTVSVSIPVTFAALWLAPRLDRFSQENPGIDVRLNCTIWNDPNAESADFQIQLLGSDFAAPHAHRLSRDRAFVVCAPQLLASRDGSKPNVFFEQLPLVSLIAKYDYWELWRRKSGALKIGSDRKIDVDTGIAALEIARHGHGIALSLSSYIAPYVGSGQLVKPFDGSIDLELSHFILRSPDRPLSRPAQAFQDFLIEEGKNTMPESEKSGG